MSIQQTVVSNTEEILIEQQIIIFPGFFSVEHCPGGLFFFLLLCIHTQTHTELCFYSVISLSIWIPFLISEWIHMDPYLEEERSFRTYGSVRHICIWKFKGLTTFSSAFSYCKPT